MRVARNNQVIVLMGALLALSGCSRESPVEEQHEVSWFVAHAAERTQTVKWCKEDVTRGGTPNCLNAEQAVEKLATTPNVPDISSGAKIP